MADIRNDQYLHRHGAGRGAITPTDPLEVLLHSGGQPISGTNRLPVEATLSGSVVILAFETSVEILPSETYRLGPIKLPYNKTRLVLSDFSPSGELVKNVSVRVGFMDPNLSSAFVFASLIEEAIPGDGSRYTAYEFESFGAGCVIDITNNGETTGTIDKLLVLGVD